ncbi:MAG: protein kinase [Kofleriaceae bacterium]
MLEGQLGEGGMGQVYRVRHAQLGKPFALKIIAPAFASDSVARERFNEEAKLASEISHPNIVSVVDFGEDDRVGIFMVMELVEGEPLLTPDSSKAMPIHHAIDALAQVADALDHIHKSGIIHGDVKAENILLVAEPSGAGTRRRRMVRLLDFGLARRHGSREEQLSGTPHYLAPERATGGSPTRATDIYALGVLGYLLFTRTLPFDGALMEILMAHIERAPERMSVRRGEPLDDAIESLIARAMAKDPEQRHPSAAAFRYELNAVMDMLDMGRRNARGSSGQIKLQSTRDQALVQLFESSRLPQMLVTVDGTIRYANSAFAKFIGQRGQSLDGRAIADTALKTYVPELPRALRKVSVEGRPIEIRAHAGGLELFLWLAPHTGDEIHVMVRIEGTKTAR